MPAAFTQNLAAANRPELPYTHGPVSQLSFDFPIDVQLANPILFTTGVVTA